MFSIILTWIGAVLGITVLLAMACGAFVLDFDDAMVNRAKKSPDVPEAPASPTAAPLA